MPIVTDGLIAYWNYREGMSGNTWNNLAPATKGKYNATLVGAALVSDGVSFNGTTNYATVPLLSAHTAYEVEVYFSSPFTGTGSMMALFGAMINNPEIMDIRGSIVGAVDNGTQLNGFAASYLTSVPKNTVVQLNFSFGDDTGTEQLHYKGAKVAEVNPAPYKNLKPSAASFGIGAALNAGSQMNFFTGKIMSIKVYSRRLTAAERSQNAAEGTNVGLASTPTTNPVALAGSSPSTSTSSGSLKRKRSVGATSHSVPAVSGSLKRSRKMCAGASAEGKAEARIKKSFRISGTVSAAPTIADAHLTSAVKLSGNAGAQADVQNSPLKLRRGIRGSSLSAGAAEGNLKAQAKLRGSSQSSADLSGELGIRSKVYVQGSSSSASESSADMKRGRKVAGSAEAQPKTEAHMTCYVAMGGDSEARSHAEGSMGGKTIRSIEGTAQAESRASGDMGIRVKLEGTAQQGADTGKALLRRGMELGGAIVMRSIASGDISGKTINLLAGSSEANSTAHARLSKQVPISGSSQSKPKVNDSSLRATVKMEGASSSISYATGSTGKRVEIAGSSSSEAKITSGVKRKRGVKGQSSASSSSEAVPSVKRNLYGYSAVEPQTYAALYVNKGLTGMAESGSKTSAILFRRTWVEGITLIFSYAGGEIRLYTSNIAALIRLQGMKSSQIRLNGDRLLKRTVAGNRRLTLIQQASKPVYSGTGERRIGITLKGDI